MHGSFAGGNQRHHAGDGFPLLCCFRWSDPHIASTVTE
jgi:hypothetical protein